MGNTPPIWVHGVGDILTVIFSLYICVWGPDRDFAPLHKDYTSSSFRFLDSYLRAFLADHLSLECVCVLLPLKLSVDKSSRPCDLKKQIFFLTQKGSMNHVPDTGEGRVIGLDYSPMRFGFTDIYISFDYDDT